MLADRRAVADGMASASEMVGERGVTSPQDQVLRGLNDEEAGEQLSTAIRAPRTSARWRSTTKAGMGTTATEL